jgi:very-short-patch-repair endonuclease
VTKPRNIVIGQRVDTVKVERAKKLRREMTPEERTLWLHLRRNQLESFAASK